MTTHLPAFRLTVYAPRSVDATEATILTPTAGSSHSDQFKVSTLTLAGWKEYLRPPRGKRGAIDPLTKRVTIGSQQVTVLDKRVSTTNTDRWVSAFIGDAAGRDALLGCKAYLEDSLDGGATWSPFFVGRVKAVTVAGLFVTLEIADAAEDLNYDVFAERPHTSIGYAIESVALPVGLAGAYGAYPGVDPMGASFGGYVLGTLARTITVDAATLSRDEWIITKQLLDAGTGLWLGYSLLPNTTPTLAFFLDTVRLRFSSTSPSITDKEVRVVSIALGARANPPRYFPVTFTVAALDATDPLYQAIDTTTVPTNTVITGTVRILSREPRTEANPLFLGNVAAVTFLQDLLDGKFGRLYLPGDFRPTGKSIGDPVKTINYDASGGSAFDKLANPSVNSNALPALRGRWPKPIKLFDLLDKHVNPVLGLSYRFEAALSGGQPVSRFVPVDMRLPTVAELGSIDTLDETDLAVGSRPTWAHSARDAVTKFVVTYYSDEIIPPEALTTYADVFPDPPGALVREVKNTLMDVDFGRATDMGAERELKIDARVIRGAYEADDATEGTQQRAWAAAEAARVPELYRTQFGSAPMIVTWSARRTSRTTGLYQGDWVYLDADVLPDPSLRARGGVRLFQVLERAEQGVVIEFSGIDAGPGTAATVPTIGTPTQTTGMTRSAVDALVTVNAQGDPVVVHYAVKATSYGTSPPGNNDTAWTFGARVTATGTVTIRNLPSSRRVFVRARSEATPGGTGAYLPRLPSAWVTPSGTKYVDTAAFTAPTGVTITPATPGTTDSIVMSWTNTETQYSLRVTLDTTVDVVFTVPPGTSSVVLNPYVTANTTYTPRVQYVDGLGNVGPQGSGAAFTVPAGWTGPATLLAPFLKVLQGGGRSQPGATGPAGIELGVAFDHTATVTIERDDNPGFTTSTAIATGWRGLAYRDLVPLDDVLRYYRAKAVASGWQDSPWSTAVSTTPVRLSGTAPQPPTADPTLVVWAVGDTPSAGYVRVYWYGDNVWRKIDNGSWVNVADGTVGSPASEDILQDGTAHVYSYRASEVDNTAPFVSNSLSIPPLGTTLTTLVVWATPNTPSAGTTRVYWYGDNVWRSVDGGAFADVADGTVGSPASEDVTQTASGHVYTYRASQVDNTPPFSTNAISIAPLTSYTALVVWAVGDTPSAGYIRVYWYGDNVWRKIDNGSWVNVADGTVGSPASEDVLQDGTAHIYTYRASDVDNTAPFVTNSIAIPVNGQNYGIPLVAATGQYSATKPTLEYTITWAAGTNTTVTLSIDGGAYSAPPASPITVTMRPPGFGEKTYTFKGTHTVNGQTSYVVIHVPEQSSAPQGPTAGNSVLNSDFQAGFAYWSSDVIANTAIETGAPLEGTKSMKLTAASGQVIEVWQDTRSVDDDTKVVAANTKLRLRVNRGGWLVVGANVKLSNAAAVCRMGFETLDSALTTIATRLPTVWDGFTASANRYAAYCFQDTEAWVTFTVQIDANATAYTAICDQLVGLIYNAPVISQGVLNPNFEQDSEFWAATTANDNPDGEADMEYTSPLTGSASFKLTLKGTSQWTDVYNVAWRQGVNRSGFVAKWNAAGMSGVYPHRQNNYIRVSTGDVVTVTATGKLSLGTLDARVGFARYAAAGTATPLAWQSMLDFSDAGVTTTQTLTGEYTIPAGTNYIVPWFTLNNTGVGTPGTDTFLVDEFMIDVNRSPGSMGPKYPTPTGGGPKTFPTGTGTSDGAGPRRHMKGYQSGTAQHGDVITFGVPFQQVPSTAVSYGLLSEPRAVWQQSTYPPTVPGTNTFITTLPVRLLSRFVNLSASGGTIEALLYQPNATTAVRTSTFSAGTITTEGGTKAVTLSTTASDYPAVNDLFRVDYDLTVTARSNSKGACQIDVTWGIEFRHSTPTPGWVRVYTTTSTAYASTPSSTDVWDDAGPRTVTMAGIDETSDECRFIVDTVTITGFDNGSDFVLDPVDVKWDDVTSGTDQYADATPDPGVVAWEAWDASQ